MTVFDDFLLTIQNEENRQKLASIFQWIFTTYPQLIGEVKWNQPMFMDHGSFILGFSVAKNWISIAPEKATMIAFKDKIKQAGYDQSMMMLKIKWNQEVNYELLQDIIDTNIREKQDIKTFWR